MAFNPSTASKRLTLTSLALSSLALCLAFVSLKADDIRSWYYGRQQMAAQPYLNPLAGDKAISWGKSQGAQLEVIPGLALSPWTVLVGEGKPQATCVIHLNRGGSSLREIASDESPIGSQQDACNQALNVLQQQVKANLAG